MSARSKFGKQLASKQVTTPPSFVISFGSTKADKAKSSGLRDLPPLSAATCASLLRLWNDITLGTGPLPSRFDPNSPSSAPWALPIADEDSAEAIRCVMRLSQPAALFCFRVLEAVVGSTQTLLRPSDAIFLATAMGACIKAMRMKSAVEVETALVTTALAHERSLRLSSQSYDALERALTSTLKARFGGDYIKAEDAERVLAAGLDYMRAIVVPSKGKVAPCLVM